MLCFCQGCGLSGVSVADAFGGAGGGDGGGTGVAGEPAAALGGRGSEFTAEEFGEGFGGTGGEEAGDFLVRGVEVAQGFFGALPELVGTAGRLGEVEFGDDFAEFLDHDLVAVEVVVADDFLLARGAFGHGSDWLMTAG